MTLAEILREAGGQVDATGQLLKGMALQPVAGLGGASRTIFDLLRGEGVDKSMAAGARTVEDIEGWGPGPFTERGEQRLTELGDVVEGAKEKAGKALGNPLEKIGAQSPATAAAILGLVEAGGPKGTRGAKKMTKKVIAKAKGDDLRGDIEAAIDPALGYSPQALATRYPQKLPGVPTVDPKSGKEFMAKQQSPEALAVEKVRKAAQKDIDKGQYTPHFPVEERFHIEDTSRYPLAERTAEVALPKKQATIDKFTEQFDTPEARARLEAAYEAKKDDPLAHNWYAMGQLENQFVNELGPEEGAKAFRQRFSQPMAATTGGADPTGNLLMSAYGNYLRENQMPQPQGAWDMPYPIGGRYASGNMEMYDKVLNQGRGLSAADQPKRHNFAANFEGHTDRSTIDEQMMQGFDPKLAAPPGMSYGVTEGVVNDLANQRGVSPADYQGVVWTGLKDTTGKPMIQVVNEAIERTRRVTGKSPEDIVRDSLVRGTHPLYGVGGAGIGTAALLAALREEEDQMR